MKNIKLVFVFILSLMLFSNITQTHAQDFKLGLGKAWFRYDNDSNKIKIGAYGTPPKLAREFNAQLFDFNTSHFSWSSVTGLNLLDPVNHDSLWSVRMTVKKDSGNGETIPLQSRTYTFQKSNWHNIYNPWELMIKYRSFTAGSLISQDSAWAVNDAEVMYERKVFYTLTTDWQTITTVRYPKPGLYFTTIEYEYEFCLGTPTYDYYDSITVYYDNRSMITFDNSVKYSGLASHAGGLQGKGFFTRLISIVDPSLDYYFRAICSTTAGLLERRIKSYKITYVLVR